MSEEEKALSVITPKMELVDFRGEIKSMKEFVSKGMHKDYDYGIHPGTNKEVLKAPGAEKLAKRFGLVPKYVAIKEVEDFQKSFFFYKYKCELYDFRTGAFAGEAIRSACSNERGMMPGAPANTVDARAQKRALLAAVRLATMASEIFYDGADEQDDDVAPMKPVTKTEDPHRVSLFSRLFACASERGFEPEAVKQNFYKKYSVDTLDKVSNAQITESIESLTLKFDVVGKGNKPRQIHPPTPPSSHPTASVPIEEAEIVEEPDAIDKELGITPEMKKEAKELSKKKALSSDPGTEDLDPAPEKEEDKPKECYNFAQCGKVLVKGKEYKEYFCSPECHKEWWDRTYPDKKNKVKFEALLEKGREASKG